ncbi:hypothetical protein BASA83_006679 [Batrachochytrium salamandrivorans]|nr:hypothetical protein BASA83_006679 [Batrachochytrium salamandrivorans]
MKLAIASTTILFAMMTAQAAVLSATSTADVNLVKRAPNGGDDDEQSDMVGQSSLAPTSQDPLTEEEKDQVKNLYGSLCRELGELTREADPIPKEISKLKALITNSRNGIGKPHLHAPLLILRLLNSRKSSLSFKSN